MLFTPPVYVRRVKAVVFFIDGGSRMDKSEPVSLNRKNSLSFSPTISSKRTLVESMELGFDQLALNGAKPSPNSVPLATGKALRTGWMAGSAGTMPEGQFAVLVPRKQSSGTPLMEAA